MSITNIELVRFLDELLKPEKVRDYCSNGLQIEGKRDIVKVVTGVTASQALIDEAVKRDADAIFVHHGYFWKGEEPCIRGMKKKRMQTLLAHDINLYAYHLPLDIHPELGNNAQLAKLLSIRIDRGLEPGNPVSVAMAGHLDDAVSVAKLTNTLEQTLGQPPLVESRPDKRIKTLAWCTGGGQSYIQMAAEQGIDAFITGEVSEQTIHTAREMDIAFFAAGHHATERYGAKAVGEYLASTLPLDVEFVDIPNPA